MKLSLQDIADLEMRLPAFFRRADVHELTRGMFSSTTLAVFQHRRCGPPGELFRKHFIYKRDDFIKWVKEYYYDKLFRNSASGNRVRHSEDAESGD